MNRLVDMLEESEVQTKVTRFSSKEGIVGLGESPFVSFKNVFLLYYVHQFNVVTDHNVIDIN